jgi:hypothetical protein
MRVGKRQPSALKIFANPRREGEKGLDQDRVVCPSPGWRISLGANDGFRRLRLRFLRLSLFPACHFFRCPPFSAKDQAGRDSSHTVESNLGRFPMCGNWRQVQIWDSGQTARRAETQAGRTGTEQWRTKGTMEHAPEMAESRAVKLLQPVAQDARRSAGRTGRRRMRLPVAAKTALRRAGASCGTLSSPAPPGGSRLAIRCVSTTGIPAMCSTS